MNLKIKHDIGIHSIKDTSEYLNAIMQTTKDGFWALDMDAQFTDVNAAYLAMSGYSRDEFLRMKVSDVDTFETPEATQAHIDRIKRDGHDIFETRHLRKDGGEFLVEVSVSYLDHDGGRMICFCRDITERKRAEDKIKMLALEKELLLKETHHRIKNDMSMIRSLLNLQAVNTTNSEARDVLMDAASRIQGMVALYGKLYQTSEYSMLGACEFLCTLIDDMILALPRTFEISTTIEIADTLLPSKVLSRLGIIVNELITNSIKYAFKDRTAGHIRITLNETDEGFRFDYADDGIGLPDHVRLDGSTGFGMQLVYMMAQDFNASFEIIRNQGTHFAINWDS